jgi:TolB-like protein
VGAWLTLQVADILFPAWGLPETSIRYLVIAGAAGFPVALVFGWFYDFTPRGIIRTDLSQGEETADLSLKRMDYVILCALLAIGAAILYGSVGKIRETAEATVDQTVQAERLPNSIAVLPFTNLDANPDTRYFSDGITEEILHRLSTLKSLHVLASTSSFAFANSNEGPGGISEKLGVRFLLQGSVRRDNDFVRITARLVDESGFQLWSDTFDRKLESIFVIQSEIAGFVSEQIVDEIVPI